jgi:hypothetical protein
MPGIFWFQEHGFFICTQVIFYSKYGIFWFQEQGFLFGCKQFLIQDGIFDFEQGVFDSEHTWNAKLEILAWNWVWKHLNISYIWIFMNMPDLHRVQSLSLE